MGKNKTGGKNFKKQKKNNDSNNKRELVFRENDQAYAMIIKSLGDVRFELDCFELDSLDKKKIGHIRGAFRKKIWMNIGDIVLVSLRDFDKFKCDIIYKYTGDEAMSLKSLGEIPLSINLQATKIELNDKNQNNVDNDFDFEFENL